MYNPVVTLSKENDIKRLEQLKSGFKRSQMIVQPQNNKLNYAIDPAFTNVNRLFVLLVARNNEDDNRYSFSDYYVPNVRIKDFNVNWWKTFFGFASKNEEEAYEKIVIW